MIRQVFWILVLASLAQSGASIFGLRKCRSRPCPTWLTALSQHSFAASIRPISIFPEEAKRFSEGGRAKR